MEVSFKVEILKGNRGFKIKQPRMDRLTTKVVDICDDGQEQLQSVVNSSVNNTPSSQINNVITSFQTFVSTGPNYVCTCCTQTFFSHNVKSTKNLKGPKQEMIAPYSTQYKSVDNQEWICNACWDAVRVGKTPKLWLNNGLKFPVRPKD